MHGAGVDEVGRGCWAGPLVAGAVVLEVPIAGLRDSKKLSPARRELLALEVHQHARAVGLGWVWPAEIDSRGLTWAVRTAMERAVHDLRVRADEIVVDGAINYLPNHAGSRALVKADDMVPSVSAASIVAKVARDRYMAQVAHALFPEYGFSRHVGYGTAHHQEMLRRFGATPEHRYSYRPIQELLVV